MTHHYSAAIVVPSFAVLQLNVVPPFAMLQAYNWNTIYSWYLHCIALQGAQLLFHPSQCYTWNAMFVVLALHCRVLSRNAVSAFR